MDTAKKDTARDIGTDLFKASILNTHKRSHTADFHISEASMYNEQSWRLQKSKQEERHRIVKQMVITPHKNSN